METAIVKHRRPYRISTVFHIIGVAWASASFGYSGSIIGTTLGQPSFLAYMGLDTNPNASQLIGAMNALFYTGGFFGCFMVGYFADKYGRKAVLAGGVSLILVSNALLAGSVNIAMFIVFRFFCGVGAHIAVTAVPLWITEIVPPKDRGMLSDIHTIFINVGYITASYVGVGFYFYMDASGKEWRGPLAIGCLPCLLCLVWLCFVPESPRYLLMKQRTEEAWEIVKTLHTRDDDPHHTFATAEFYQMRKQLQFDRTLKSSYWEMFRHYGTLLYGGLGYDTEQQLLFQAGWLAVSFACNVFAVIPVDRFARPTLLTFGLCGCLAAVVCEAALQATYLGGTNKSGLAAGVAMLYVYVFFYAVCLDGPSYFYMGEIFPTHLRAQGMTLGVAVLCLANVIWLQAAPTAFANIGWKYYLFFISITAIGALCVFFTFPDTLNKPLEEVARLFGDEDLVVIYQRDIHVDENTNEVIAEGKDGGVSHIETRDATTPEELSEVSK